MCICVFQHILLVGAASVSATWDIDEREENAVQEDLQLPPGNGGKGSGDLKGIHPYPYYLFCLLTYVQLGMGNALWRMMYVLA